MEDNVIVGIKNNFRVYICYSKNTISEAIKKHNLWPLPAKALSRMISINAIMAKMLKDKQKVVSILNGNGPLGTVMVEADSFGNVRGYVANPTFSSKSKTLSLAKAVGKKGYLQVIKDLQIKKPYDTKTKIIDGEITNEFINYFYKSEQIKTALIIGELFDQKQGVVSAGAILFQLLPNHTEKDIIEIENILKSITNFAQKLHVLGTKEFLIKNVSKIKIIDEQKIRFHCFCNKEKMLLTLNTLPRKDKEDILKEGKCQIKCQYCSKIKTFMTKDLKELLSFEKIT